MDLLNEFDITLLIRLKNFLDINPMQHHSINISRLIDTSLKQNLIVTPFPQHKMLE